VRTRRRTDRPGRHIVKVLFWACQVVDGKRPRHRRAIARLAGLALQARAQCYVWSGL
jgi:hypothetical protein